MTPDPFNSIVPFLPMYALQSTPGKAPDSNDNEEGFGLILLLDSSCRCATN